MKRFEPGIPIYPSGKEFLEALIRETCKEFYVPYTLSCWDGKSYEVARLGQYQPEFTISFQDNANPPITISKDSPSGILNWNYYRPNQLLQGFAERFMERNLINPAYIWSDYLGDYYEWAGFHPRAYPIYKARKVGEILGIDVGEEEDDYSLGKDYSTPILGGACYLSFYGSQTLAFDHPAQWSWNVTHAHRPEIKRKILDAYKLEQRYLSIFFPDQGGAT